MKRRNLLAFTLFSSAIACADLTVSHDSPIDFEQYQNAHVYVSFNGDPVESTPEFKAALEDYSGFKNIYTELGEPIDIYINAQLDSSSVREYNSRTKTTSTVYFVNWQLSAMTPDGTEIYRETGENREGSSSGVYNATIQQMVLPFIPDFAY